VDARLLEDGAGGATGSKNSAWPMGASCAASAKRSMVSGAGSSTSSTRTKTLARPPLTAIWRPPSLDASGPTTVPPSVKMVMSVPSGTTSP